MGVPLRGVGRKGVVEVGLHFEGDRQESLGAQKLLRQRWTEAQQPREPAFEFEEWDQG